MTHIMIIPKIRFVIALFEVISSCLNGCGLYVSLFYETFSFTNMTARL